MHLLVTIIFIVQYYCLCCSDEFSDSEASFNSFLTRLGGFPQKRCLFLSLFTRLDQIVCVLVCEVAGVLSGDGVYAYLEQPRAQSTNYVKVDNLPRHGWESRPYVAATHLTDTFFMNRNETLNPATQSDS